MNFVDSFSSKFKPDLITLFITVYPYTTNELEEIYVCASKRGQLLVNR